jgi:hypothetical protein
MDHETLAVELVQALRGKRSCAELSRRIGYRSNVVQRWESRHSFPTASRFLAAQRRVRPARGSWLEGFFRSPPDWAACADPTAPQTVAAFLRHLKGKTPVSHIAELAGRNRFTVARWFSGATEPKLPEFLQAVDLCSRRLFDLVAALEDPRRVPSVREGWARLELAREAAYTQPWSHAVLRALELNGMPRGCKRQVHWIARQLTLSVPVVREALRTLEATAQVELNARGYRTREVISVDTSRDPERAHALKVAWTRTALERLAAKTPGTFGYSLFAISKQDLARLQALQSQYVRAMQQIVASSKANDCVGLYCAQLFELGAAPIDVSAASSEAGSG